MTSQRSGASVPASAPRWVRAADGVVDGGLLAFAVWTLVYELDLALQWSLWWPARLWVLVAVVLVAVCVRRELRLADDAPAPGTRPATALRNPVLLAAAVLLATLAVLLRGVVGVVPLALVGLLVLGAGLWVTRRPAGPADPSVRDEPGPGVPLWAHGVAAATSLGLGVLGSLLLKFDADDVYYVNRATWVAQRGTPTTHDTLFSQGVLSGGYLGGLPLPSVEALQGALAHAIGVSGPTFCYVVCPPVLGLAGGWVLWRLVRSWAPRAHVLVFLVAVAFVLASALGVYGNYSLGRIWQGKVVALVVLLPLVWWHLGRLAAGRDRWSQLQLLVCGIAFVGLTATAPLVTVVVVGSALLAALLLRSGPLAVGALLLLVAPLVAGVVIALAGGPVAGVDPAVLSAADSLTVVLGSGAGMVVLAVLGLLVGARLAATRELVVLASCSSLAVMVALLPGMLSLANVVTGAGPVIWRLLTGSPLPVLVGLLVVWRPAEGRRPVGALAAAVAVAVLLVLAGTPLWSARVGASIATPTTWRVPPGPLEDVRDLPTSGVRRGLWLLPPPQMSILSISSTTRTSVVPREFYLPGPGGDREEADRALLFRLVNGQGELSAAPVRAALDRLDVAVACVPEDRMRVRAVLTRAVGEPLTRIGSMRCHVERR